MEQMNQTSVNVAEKIKQIDQQQKERNRNTSAEPTLQVRNRLDHTKIQTKVEKPTQIVALNVKPKDIKPEVENKGKNQVRATSVNTNDLIAGLKLNKIDEEVKKVSNKRTNQNNSKLNNNSIGPVNGGQLYARSMI